MVWVLVVNEAPTFDVFVLNHPVEVHEREEALIRAIVQVYCDTTTQ